MDAKVKKNLNSEEGQAFFELIIFLPFVIFLFVLLMTFGNSINGAINQQKVLRGFFWHYVRNDSYIPNYSDLVQLQQTANIRSFGMYSFGYRLKEGTAGSSSLAACYPVSRFFGGDVDETCEQPTPAAEEQTSFIRLFNFYGTCTADYIASNGQYSVNYSANLVASCVLTD
ncbi:MAG: hypothetical protein ACPGJV_07845 [Bacteriovoracaceae bacterium]